MTRFSSQLKSTEKLDVFITSDWLCENCKRVLRSEIDKEVSKINKSYRYHKKRVQILAREINELLAYRRNI